MSSSKHKTRRHHKKKEDEEEEEEPNMLIYTTANRNDAYKGAADMLEDYSELNATPKPAIPTRAGHGHVHPTRKRVTPQCYVGTSSSNSAAKCVTATAVSVPKYQHRQG